MDDRDELCKFGGTSVRIATVPASAKYGKNLEGLKGLFDK
jgi:hypothetical protein